MKNKTIYLLALLLTSATAWAEDTNTVRFEANGNTVDKTGIALSHTFSCDFENENGELDEIIRELYGLTYGGYCDRLGTPSVTGGSDKVTAEMNDDDLYIEISAPFEGTATVTGTYYAYSDELKHPATFDFTLTISTSHSATFATGNDNTGWTISPTESTAGTTVTVSYEGVHKVKSVSVKAKPSTLAGLKAAINNADATALAELRTDYAGKVICSSGHLHDAKTAVPSGCTAVAVLGYIDEGNCYAIALQDGGSTYTWNSITNNGENTDTNCAVPGTWGVAAPTGASWVVATRSIYEGIFNGLGSDGSSYNATSNAFITESVGGTALTDNYWTTTLGNYNTVAVCIKNTGMYHDPKDNNYKVRPVLVY